MQANQWLVFKLLTTCQYLTIDLTSSSGNAGRSFVTAIIATIVGQRTDLSSSLNLFLAANYTITPLKLLANDATYSFAVTLCNFLGNCGTSSAVVSVSSNDTIFSTLQFVGSNSVSTYRYLSFSIEASAFIQACDGSISNRGLQYTYSLVLVQYQGTSYNSTFVARQTSDLLSISPNAAIFRLNSFQLYAPAVYSLTLTVSTSSTTSSSTVVGAVNVVQRRIIAVIRGGSQVTIRTDILSNIDASLSYDEDVYQLTGSTAGLQFVWSCIQIAPVFSQTCVDTIRLVSGIFADQADRESEGVICTKYDFSVDSEGV